MSVALKKRVEARRHTLTAIEALVEIMMSNEAPDEDRAAAANALISRGFDGARWQPAADDDRDLIAIINAVVARAEVRRERGVTSVERADQEILL